MPPRPLVGISADVKTIPPHPYHCVGDKYVRAVDVAADCLPLMVPALGDDLDVAQLLDTVDGVLLTGSYANVHPGHYGGGDPFDGSPLDPARDATTLRLVPAVLARGIPLLGVCRGFQEMNVALGGSLHQKVHEIEGYDNHLENPEDPVERQYGPSHPVELVPGGLLASMSATRTPEVNSLHGQGIDRLAPGLVVEARAPDGLIEGFRVGAATGFALAVQWHPEWRPAATPFYAALWRAFGAACAAYRQSRYDRSARAVSASGS